MPTYEYSSVSVHLTAHFCAQRALIEHELQLEDCWKLEALGVSETVSVNDDTKARQKFNDTAIFKYGRYQVTLS